MKVKKAVITAAGLGTRLLPISKELPKEMLPIYLRNSMKGIILKPLLQALFEQLYLFGIKEFCFVVGRGKRAIEDHFTPDWGFVAELNRRGKRDAALELERFYKMIESSVIVWINQPEPRGFGHAVSMAEPFVGNEPFMVCAGDTYIISKNNTFLKRMTYAFSKDEVYAVILLQEIPNPGHYGVADIKDFHNNVFRVVKVIEKPKKPLSNFAIMPYYIFRPEIIKILKKLKPGVGDEIQLTDAIQKLIDMGQEVRGVLLGEDDLRLDIGTPTTYWEAVKLSYEHSVRGDHHV